MKRNAWIVSFLAGTLAVLSGCSSGPATKEDAKSTIALDKIQGKIQVLAESSGSTDAALSAGGPSIYLWEGVRRYRLFVKEPVQLVHGQEYVAEGIYAQKAIDEIGDPDQGKNGYPLQSSCERVVRTVWPGLPFDVTDGHVSVLRARVKRYPARPVFLVTKIRPVTADADKKKDAVSGDEDIPEVSVTPEKQSALLVEGPIVQPAPLWEPTGGTARCKVLINSAGKISDLETGSQLCEAVPWSQFRYQPPVQAGHPVKVKTEVEVRFEPRK